MNMNPIIATSFSQWVDQHRPPGATFDRTLAPGVLGFEVVTVLGFLLAIFVLRRFSDRILIRFGIVAVAVFIFEMFTGPMWRNLHLGRWAYTYLDVSWVLTMGWTSVILTVVVLVDHFFKGWSDFKRFALYLVFLTGIVFVLEASVVGLGIRQYSPEVKETVIGTYVFGVPVEFFYYINVFMTLVISFYKYWSFQLDRVPIVPVKNPHWLRTLGITVAGVLLFELMVEPMVRNVGFPRWSYVYHDITFLMTGVWVIVIWLSVNAVDKLLVHWDLGHRFACYIFVTGLVCIPIEGWFIQHGYRVYGPSAVANFSGFKFFGTQVPMEVLFGIPLYFALVIGFVRFVEIVITNRR